MGNLAVYVLVFCTVALLILGITADKFEAIANLKGHSGYYWWCFWLGVIGWAMVIALPDRRSEIKSSVPAVTPTQETETPASTDDDDTLPAL